MHVNKNIRKRNIGKGKDDSDQLELQYELIEFCCINMKVIPTSDSKRKKEVFEFYGTERVS